MGTWTWTEGAGDHRGETTRSEGGVEVRLAVDKAEQEDIAVVEVSFVQLCAHSESEKELFGLPFAASRLN